MRGLGMCLALLTLLPAMARVAAGQTPPPSVPITRFPGADWSRISCTPGAAVHEAVAVNRLVRTFIDRIERGRVDPKIAGPAITAVDPGGVTRFFRSIGPVRKLEFRHANATCSRDAVNASYRVIGTDASALLTFTIARGRIEGYAQGER